MHLTDLGRFNHWTEVRLFPIPRCQHVVNPAPVRDKSITTHKKKQGCYITILWLRSVLRNAIDSSRSAPGNLGGDTR